MSEVETVEYRGVTVEIHYDEYTYERNPWRDDELSPSMVLFPRADKEYGWTDDDHLMHLVGRFLDDSRTRNWAVLDRWLRIYHDVVAILPMSVLDHSGLTAYLGDGAHWCDPGGWDSSWLGFIMVTGAQLTEWGFTDPADRTREKAEKHLRASFKEFADWVSGHVYGYVIQDLPVDEIDSCWGFYGMECWDEARGDKPMGYMREQFQDVIDHALADQHSDRVQVFKNMIERKH